MSRLPQLMKLHEADPADVDLLYMVGHELYREGRHAEAVDWLTRYTQRGTDVGAAFGLIADCCEQLGQAEEARQALLWGIEAARRAGHPTMAGEFQSRLDEMS